MGEQPAPHAGIDGRTRLLGVLGRSIEFTLSPAINNFAARYLQVNSVFVPLLLDAPAALADTLHFLQSSNFDGLNVTTPYKRRVAELLQSDVPSVNLVYRAADNSLQATSTDGAGFWQALRHTHCQRERLQTVTMLGNGGACAALLHFFCQQKLPLQKITILRRNPAHDENLAQINDRRYQLVFADFTPEQLRASIIADSSQQLLIQTTSAPQHGDDLQRFCAALTNFQGTLVDLVYDCPSALYHSARARNLPCQDGLPMLIEQARLGQEKWWGKCAPYDKIYACLRGAV